MNYAKIKPVDVANGEGVRVSIFVSGCPHHCEGCFNEELWGYDVGQEFGYDTVMEILELCSKPYIAGLSILGGEPLAPENAAFTLVLCHIFKTRFPRKDIWLYTGYKWEQVKGMTVMKYVDVVVDGKFIEELKDPRLKFRGSSNQRIILTKPSLENGAVYVRKDLMG